MATGEQAASRQLLTCVMGMKKLLFESAATLNERANDGPFKPLEQRLQLHLDC
jgi:hypothetical protein